MATCKDCIHFVVCEEVPTKSADDCDFFKDRSQVAELKYAEWIEDEDMYGDPIYRCSACNERFVLEEGTPTDNGYSYCPNCGAVMRNVCLSPEEGDDE